jgi:hypothetical protein
MSDLNKSGSPELPTYMKFFTLLKWGKEKEKGKKCGNICTVHRWLQI